MSNENGWHKGDRVYCRANKQHGVVDGWKDGKLLVCWGLQQEKQGYIRSWVTDEDCVWQPAPIEVLDERGSRMAVVQEGIRPAPNSVVVTPTPMYSKLDPTAPLVPDRMGGCDLSKYRL